MDDLPVLGNMPPAEAAAKLREVGEDETAAALESGTRTVDGSSVSLGIGDLLPFLGRPCLGTTHEFGFVGRAPIDSGPLPVRQAGGIEPDLSLKNARIKITLSRLRVADYPGGGTHLVLFDFYAESQLLGQVEHVHYNATVRAHEGEQAAIINYPIFNGLGVGTQGVAFKCLTVNVRNEQDEAFLSFLDADVFRAGLTLVSTAQPAIGPLSQMAISLTKAIGSRNRNVPVQEFQMGLDFNQNPFGAVLAEGAYIAVQMPPKVRLAWDWDEWVYSPKRGEIVSAADSTELIPYNYLVFGVSRYADE
jgi:hypothetical protein